MTVPDKRQLRGRFHLLTGRPTMSMKRCQSPLPVRMAADNAPATM
jgi:hypothetical protein